MTKGQVYERDGRMMIELRQQKTGTLVAVPAHRDLLPTRPPRGAVWRHAAGAVADRPALPAPQLLAQVDKAMRRMALRRARALFRQGWPSSTASGAISGHKIDFCQQIIDTYLPRRTEVAIAATSAWEAAEDAHGQAPAACACETQGHRSVPGF